MYSSISANKLNTILIMAVFVAFVVGILWIVSQILGYGNGTLPFFIAGAFLYTIFQYFAASRIAMTLSGAHEIQKKDNPRLWRSVENISITEGLPMPRVFIIDDTAPNAMATGRNPKKAMVAATTGLLDIMDDRELDAVMAHEMGHVKNYDIRVSMIAFGLASLIGVISDIILHMMWFGGGRNNENNGNIFTLVIGLLAVVLSPLVAAMIQFAISRQREYLADATSVMTTRDPDGMIDALKKLQNFSQPMRRQNSSTAHLFLNNPLKKGGLSGIFSTHPPIERRIERLQGNKTKL